MSEDRNKRELEEELRRLSLAAAPQELLEELKTEARDAVWELEEGQAQAGRRAASGWGWKRWAVAAGVLAGVFLGGVAAGRGAFPETVELAAPAARTVVRTEEVPVEKVVEVVKTVEVPVEKRVVVAKPVVHEKIVYRDSRAVEEPTRGGEATQAEEPPEGSADLEQRTIRIALGPRFGSGMFPAPPEKSPAAQMDEGGEGDVEEAAGEPGTTGEEEDGSAQPAAEGGAAE